MSDDPRLVLERRGFLTLSTLASAAAVVSACRSPRTEHGGGPAQADEKKGEKSEKEDEDVGALEDLMREHGVLRRALVVYRESATRLRAGTAVDPGALQKTAKMFRDFGEAYHEQKLEEAHVFPTLKKKKPELGSMVDALVEQHHRGRDITDWLLAVTTGPKIGAKAEDVARLLEQFARMYETHAAREDTVIFPAWKKALGAHEVKEQGEKFEDIEKQTFGHDGFDDAAKTMSEVEGALGLADLAQFTAPAPPPKP